MTVPPAGTTGARRWLAQRAGSILAAQCRADCIASCAFFWKDEGRVKIDSGRVSSSIWLHRPRPTSIRTRISRPTRAAFGGGRPRTRSSRTSQSFWSRAAAAGAGAGAGAAASGLSSRHGASSSVARNDAERSRKRKIFCNNFSDG